jgi:serine/threonine-protein kinase
VKPDNIFLHRTPAGMTVTKLLDFGILSLLDATHHETAGRFLGTLRYAAPEQLRGEKPTAKVDVYAAGLVLFEMVAGRGPFDAEGDPHKVASAHLHKPAPALSSFVVVPRELDALVNASLSKLPGQRPRDAFSFAASLRNLKKALTGAASPDSTENRATAAMVAVGPESAPTPFVRVQHPVVDGPYVISPVPPGTPPGTPPGVQPVAAAFTTMTGMPEPSVAPAQALALGPTATSPQSVDRAALTNSFVPDVLPSPQNDTSALVAGSGGTLASAAPPPVQPVAFRWPPEQPPARSEEPQVRTLSGTPLAPARSVAPVIAAVLLMVVLALASVVLLVVRLRASSPGAAAKRPTVTAPMPSPPVPQPVVVMPAPTLAPPMLDDTPAPTPAPAASLSSAPAQPPVATSQPILPVRRAPATTAMPARPGPGF